MTSRRSSALEIKHLSPIPEHDNDDADNAADAAEGLCSDLAVGLLLHIAFL